MPPRIWSHSHWSSSSSPLVTRSARAEARLAAAAGSASSPVWRPALGGAGCACPRAQPDPCEFCRFARRHLAGTPSQEQGKHVFARYFAARAAAGVRRGRAQIKNNLVRPSAARTQSPDAGMVGTDIPPQTSLRKGRSRPRRGSVGGLGQDPIPRPHVHGEHSSCPYRQRACFDFQLMLWRR
jgi:hypothetical protein